jgi:hypothetical protein
MMASAMLLIGCLPRPRMRDRPAALSDQTPWGILASQCRTVPQSPLTVVCAKSAVRAAGHACIDFAEALELCQADSNADAQFCAAQLSRSRDALSACEIALDTARADRWLWFGGGVVVSAITAVAIGFALHP